MLSRSLPAFASQLAHGDCGTGLGVTVSTGRRFRQGDGFDNGDGVVGWYGADGVGGRGWYDLPLAIDAFVGLCASSLKWLRRVT